MSRTQEQLNTQGNQGGAAGDQAQFEITGDDVQGWKAILPTGQVYKGGTQAELLQQVVQGQVHSSLTLQQKEQQLQETRQLLLEQERQNRQKGREEGGDRTRLSSDQNLPEFDKQRYWELINSDPLAAQEYINQHYYGVPEPRAAFQKTRVVSEFVSDALATREFLSDNVDFPSNAQNSERLLNEVLDRGLDITSHNLERVWRDFKKTGVIQPLTQEEIAAERERMQVWSGPAGNPTGQVNANLPPGAPPPSPNTATSTLAEQQQMSDEEARFAAMTHQQKTDYLRSKGLM